MSYYSKKLFVLIIFLNLSIFSQQKEVEKLEKIKEDLRKVKEELKTAKKELQKKELEIKSLKKELSEKKSELSIFRNFLNDLKLVLEIDEEKESKNSTSKERLKEIDLMKSPDFIKWIENHRYLVEGFFPEKATLQDLEGKSNLKRIEFSYDALEENIIYGNKSLLICEWKNGLPTGSVVQFIRPNFIYIGEFQNLSLSGFAKIIYPHNKTEYMGYVVNGKHSGLGRLENPDGTLIKEGVWNNQECNEKLIEFGKKEAEILTKISAFSIFTSE